MRRSLCNLLTLCGIFSIASTLAAQTVTTDPVGFTTTTIAANTIRALSLPIDNMPSFNGPVAARTSNTIQSSSPGWTANAFGPFASNPYIIRVLSGTSQGRQFRIASNTTDTLTITTGGVDLTSALANGDRYEIFQVDTLASLFGNPPTGLNTSTDPALADNVSIRGTSAWANYYHDGSNWVRQGPGTVSNTVALLPDQGFLFVRRGGASIPLTITGAVPVSNLITDLPANRVTSFANRFPVSTNLVSLGLHQLADWNKSTDPALADNVQIRGSSSWTTYYYDPATGGPTNGVSGSWIRQGPQSFNQNPQIGIGTSVVVLRRGGNNIVLNQALPYSLN